MLDNYHTLWPAESSEGSVRRLACLANHTFGSKVREVVASIDVEQCSVENGPRKVKGKTPVVVKRNIETDEARSRFCDLCRCLVRGHESMPRTGKLCSKSNKEFSFREHFEAISVEA